MEDHSIYSTKYYPSLRSLIKFEIISFLGRKIFISKPSLKKDSPNLLHLGCGPYIFDNWINADFFDASSILNKDTAIKPQWFLDLRYPLNCNNDVWDGVFSEHIIEHLYPMQAVALFKEIFRVLKPSAWLRVSVPDLQQFINFYVGKEVDDLFYQRWNMKSEAMWSLIQNWGHRGVFDEVLLKKFLTDAGFINIQKVGFQQGSDPRLIKDNPERRWESLYMEAQKPCLRQ